MLQTDLSGKTAIITGASSGIGRETARVFAREGATVVVAARRESRLEDLASELEDEHDTRVVVAPTDVTASGEVEDMVVAARSEFGTIDVVVCNAGIGRYASLLELTDDQFSDMIDVNVRGSFYTTQVTLPDLRDSGGNLIFVGSFAGKYPYSPNPVYGATKWWLRGFAYSLAAEPENDAVGITVINPSSVRTEFGAQDRQPNNDRYEEGEVTESIDVAEAIAFAARQGPPNTIAELDFYRRDKFSQSAEEYL